MATRFYFSSTLVPSISPAFAVNWDGTAEGVYRTMTTNPDGSPTTTFQVFAGGTHGAGIRRIAVSFVSPPLAAGNAFDTGDTLKMVAHCAESGLDDNLNRMPIVLKVWDSTGTTVRATLKALGHYGPSTTEWQLINTTTRMPLDGDTLDASYTTVDGDRLALEVGGQVSAAGGTTVQGEIHFGAPRTGSSDLAETEGVLTGGRPWFEISRDLTFTNSTPCFHRQPRFFRQRS